MDFAERWVNSMKQHKFSEYLYPKQELILRIKTETESFHLSVSREKVESLIGFSGNEDAIITGSAENLLKLINGKIKLQDAIKYDKIEVETSFRTLLLLESIFWFSR